MITPLNARRIVSVIMALLTACLAHAQAPATGSIARIVIWQPKSGMSRDFEEGYKRHLEWHRRNNDSWRWYGWMLSSGEHDGRFMDGTFSHAWTDFDHPVSPAQDGADNTINVLPYAEVKSVAAYEVVSAQASPDFLAQPLMTFCFFDVQTDRAREFESLFNEVMKASSAQNDAYVLLRPENGVSEYLLMIPARKASELGAHAALVARLLQAQHSTIVLHYRTETARFHSDLSYLP